MIQSSGNEIRDINHLAIGDICETEFKEMKSQLISSHFISILQERLPLRKHI